MVRFDIVIGFAAVIIICIVVVLFVIRNVGRKSESGKPMKTSGTQQQDKPQNKESSKDSKLCMDEKRFRQVEKAIDRALEEPKNLEVYYQPIYSIKENKVIAAEALLRLFDEEYGEILPEEFVYVAEKNGKIVELGHAALERVCTFLAKETAQDCGIKYIEVNLSILECLREELPMEIEQILTKHGIAPEQINLEIKEGALLQKNPMLAKNMDVLMEKGIRFSLDDYGTGASALTYIITFPFEIVKIDRDVLWTAMASEHAMMALCASINMIKDMHMKIVVEGVESKEAAEKLKKMGCDYLQGYYFAKPLPEQQFMEYISKCEEDTNTKNLI